jgi:hypothetical protein
MHQRLQSYARKTKQEWVEENRFEACHRKSVCKVRRGSVGDWWERPSTNSSPGPSISRLCPYTIGSALMLTMLTYMQYHAMVSAPLWRSCSSPSEVESMTQAPLNMPLST